MLREDNTEVEIMESVDYGDTNLNHIIEGESRRADREEDYGKHGYSQQEFADGELVDVEDEPEDEDFEEFTEDFEEFDDDDDMDLE